MLWPLLGLCPLRALSKVGGGKAVQASMEYVGVLTQSAPPGGRGQGTCSSIYLFIPVFPTRSFIHSSIHSSLNSFKTHLVSTYEVSDLCQLLRI